MYSTLLEVFREFDPCSISCCGGGDTDVHADFDAQFLTMLPNFHLREVIDNVTRKLQREEDGTARAPDRHHRRALLAHRLSDILHPSTIGNCVLLPTKDMVDFLSHIEETTYKFLDAIPNPPYPPAEGTRRGLYSRCPMLVSATNTGCYIALVVIDAPSSTV